MSHERDALLRALMGNTLASLAQPTILTMAASSRARWSARFETWAKPLSESEDQKCQNAESVVRSALDGHPELEGLNIQVFAQGSYKANTNVRADSDVDICVRCTNTFHFSLPTNVSRSEAFISPAPATLDFSTYKTKIATALYHRFTIYGVEAGDKAFTVTENTYRIKADVIPTLEYREYFLEGSTLRYRTGVCFFTRSGNFIVNWPEQTLANGKAKNERTGRRYKKVVRVLKGLRNEMEMKGIESAKKIASFQIACLAYNIMDSFFEKEDLYDDVKGVALQIWYHAFDSGRCAAWTEVDGIKKLFPQDQPNKPKEVADFFWELLQYAGLND